MIRPHELSFRWRESGAGEPFILLHGLLGDMEHWEASLADLDDICRPIALSLPVFAPVAEPSVPAMVDHVRRFLDALHLERAIIGGNSFGGHIALETALAAPDRVSALLLSGSAGLVERSFTRGVPTRPTTEYVRAKMEEVFYQSHFVTPARVERVRAIFACRHQARRVVACARSARRRSLAGRLGEIAVPALLLWGKEDRITPPEVAEAFRAGLPDAELVLIPNSGHAPMLEQPDAFNTAVWWWLHDTRFRRNPPAIRLPAVG
jgi:pimeloyl-ACP methyl ester carboxylesterase